MSGVLRRIAKELVLTNGKNEIVSEHDEQTICDAERQDAATRQLVKPQEWWKVDDQSATRCGQMTNGFKP
jgi:hypothetical protein